MMKCLMTTLSKRYFGAHFMICVAKIMDNIKVVLLSCVTTGRAFDPEIGKQLLLSVGKLLRDPFISGCKIRPAWHERKFSNLWLVIRLIVLRSSVVAVWISLGEVLPLLLSLSSLFMSNQLLKWSVHDFRDISETNR